ncbi:ATP-binding protein [Nonomuraea sp. NN258]|uniref:ATP-binding protein n=1 Tax=Nonomuraea antri TaxID=2730852 RepID=UPI001569641D|nr:ATP-binding protein [Nonomuraea antri]NRQ33953.1 ATP-binding protein [Nonomuraea antri]
MNQHHKQQAQDQQVYGGSDRGLSAYGQVGEEGGGWRRAEGFPELQPGPVLAAARRGQGWEGMWRRAFIGRADQAAPARRLVRLLLDDTGCAEDAEWVAAELISNALLHSRSGEAGGLFVVEVARTAERVRLSVYDLGGGVVPDFGRAIEAARERPGQREGGYGLLGVAELAARVGVSGDRINGHAVWAEFHLVPTGPGSLSQLSEQKALPARTAVGPAHHEQSVLRLGADESSDGSRDELPEAATKWLPQDVARARWGQDGGQDGGGLDPSLPAQEAS